jgi:hypothetical protein
MAEIEKRHPRTQQFLMWAGPSLLVSSVAVIGLIAALASPFTGVKDWAESFYARAEPVVTAPWFVALSVLLVLGYIAALLYTGLPPRTPSSAQVPAQRQAVLYLTATLERAPTRAVGDGTLVIFMLDVWSNGLGFGFTRKTKSYSESRNPQIDWKGQIPLVQKCVVTNYGPDPLADIRLKVDGEVREVKITPTSTQSGDIIMSGNLDMRLDKIDPGEDQSFTFYIQNGSPFALVLQLKDAEAQSIRTGQVIRVPVDTNAPARLIPLLQAPPRAACC